LTRIPLPFTYIIQFHKGKDTMKLLGVPGHQGLQMQSSVHVTVAGLYFGHFAKSQP